ncbi:DUF1206 domain-containing protein [Tenggerimyces flavus]|uniref:DUF1206 domain-containing protein n=1 Tax=Tenggerimyces flavus TaxID=1708749 RepID=A0ABV7YH58_9ACTN|nr:DUF1206 domain-containing protein [Tenggerimyces flavus]MBM7789851.1 hypothetical protein [Tenggerimyces flavus]
MSAGNAEATAHEAARSKPVRLLGRVGLVAYGLVHVLVAFLAIRIAIGESGSAKPSKGGALQTIAEQPGGVVLLWLIVVGLAAFTVWQLAVAIWGHRNIQDRGSRTKRRVSSAAHALVVAALAFTAAKTALGKSSSGGGQQTLTAKVLAMPAGFLLVGAVGVAVICVAANLVYRGWKKKFTEELDFKGASPAAVKSAIRLGQIGYGALGVAYGTVGMLIVVAAATHDANKQTGLDAALKTLAEQPFGKILLGIIAVGLACFGLYCVLDARYRED